MAPWMDLAGVFIAFALPLFFAIGVAQQFGWGVDGDVVTPEKIEVSALLMWAGYAGVFVYALWWSPLPVLRLQGTMARVARFYFWFFLAWLAFVFVHAWALAQLGVQVEAQPHLIYFEKPAVGRPAFWLVLASICVVGPLAEEFVFRGFLQRALTGPLSLGAAVVAQAVPFGVIHGWDKALPLGVVGLFFGWLRTRSWSGGLWAPFLAHVLHNTLMVTFVMVFGDVLSGYFMV